MTRARKQYSREFKQEALQFLEAGRKSASQPERELGIGRGNLSRWKREFSASGEDAFPGNGRLMPEQGRLRQLDRENEILRQERDILQKASGHLFAAKQVRFWFIEDHRDEFPVLRMCQVLGVSPSGYYAWRGRPGSGR